MDARKHAQNLWNASPCGHIEGQADNIEYFDGVAANRYALQPWAHKYFNYGQYSGKRVLEIGVGHGTDLLQFSGADRHAIDITEKHLELAQKNFSLRGLPVTLKNCDATSIDYPDQHFDCVYSFGVIHHIPEADRVFSEVHRVLKPGGTFMVALYYKWSFFHLVNLLAIKGILMGKLFRLGYGGLLSTIEKGADGSDVKPYVKLYSRSDLRAALAAFNVSDISVHQLALNHIIPGLPPRVIGSMGGWYVTAKATK